MRWKHPLRRLVATLLCLGPLLASEPLRAEPPPWRPLIERDALEALRTQVGEPPDPVWLQGADGASPLILAVQAGAARTTQWLLQQGAAVDARTARGSSALALASARGDVAMVRTLALAGAQLGLKSPNGYQPLDWALERGQLATVQALLEIWEQRAGAEAGSLPLLRAVAAQDLGRLDALLRAGHDPNQPNPSGFAPLALAARIGPLPLLQSLLRHGADPRVGGQPGHDVAGALNQAARGLQVELARALIEAGAEVRRGNAKGFTPLHLAAFVDHEQGALTSLLLAQGAAPRQPAEDGYDALDVALEQRNRLFMRLALRRMVTEAGAAGATPTLRLSLAVLEGDVSELRRLLAAGAQPDGPNPAGHGPLALAAAWGELELAQALLAAGARVDAAGDNRYRSTPLMEATRDGRTAMAGLLLAHGAPINQLDRNQDHALNWATFFGHTELVALLLAHGADPAQAGRDSGDNALAIAQRRQFPAVQAVLQAALKAP
ncbi:ankyrin repeat domain-containing protein [Inhella proteolytica]|uniref:Ankyrin repeat domain-containing protein n=1 Tax=Inhella proteolytica TaxID=2795029 RepID=A0A931NF58_9BURK|nr:ankyrin repeat domain-containing protein [Inhella proteolytica]MBH9575298.1 ankyrin repeat domain-containing protein [Inhella proteolytica]